MARRLKFPSLYAVNDERLHGARLNITEYKPVSDASGRVIGALFVGVDIDAQIQALEDQIHALKVGESGYYFVMDASNGPSRGKFIVHPSATGQASDDQNGPFSQMLDAKQGRIDYTSKDATLSESNARDKTVSFLSVPEWHWVIGGVALRDEVMAEVTSIRNRFAAIALALLAVFAAVFLFVVRRLVSRPLDEVAAAAGELAAGDLTVRLGQSRAAGDDEIGRLVLAIDGVGEGLARIVAQVREASAQVTGGTTRLSASSGEHCGAHRDASCERGANGREHGGTHFDRAAKRGACGAGERRGQRRGGCRTARGLQWSRRKCVRALAQRSAAAAKEIAGVIAESTSTIQGGYKVAEEASAAMQGIVSRVEQVRSIIADIAVASRQQSAGIEQVGIAVTQIGEATQQNATLVEEAADVARSLEAQAASLDGAVSAFKLAGGT